MTGALDNGTPAMGLYEQLITLRLVQRLEEMEEMGFRPIEQQVGSESVSHVLARHVADTVRKVLHGLPAAEQVHAANHILESISTLTGAREWVDLVADGPRQLLALAKQRGPGVFDLYDTRPTTPLADTALLTNAPEDPNLGFELRAELATADRVDLLCAFVKWHGIRVLEKQLENARERNVPIRVITTTYMGATEQRALDRLAREFGAQIKINYEIRSTRLHAKAWLFRRNSGYDTSYVGSSNLSKAALLDGLEWNVRLSSVATPDVLKKFETTFDSYWSESAFESYDPDVNGDQLRDALLLASNGEATGSDRKISLSGLEVRPYPHQQDMLERLEVAREVYGRHQNLLVAATGTGKTIMAALDYKNLRKKLGRDLRLLFVAHRKEILGQSLRAFREILIDGNFGETLVGGDIPNNWKHVFASVQSLNLRTLDQIDQRHFDVVIIDEFHHGTAPTYRRIVDHFEPSELLGLTATPERMDGTNIQDEFFDGHIAAEMRLWEALEKDLLTPFHYFGIADTTDLTDVRWTRGSYDRSALGNVYTGDHARARLVVKSIQEKIANPGGMRALGFCVTVAHAQFMASFFQRAGIDAVALSGSTPSDQREAALRALARGEIQVVFSVDLFNEGLDIPTIDTLLLLRPTSSATVFLQQLGRGLRRCDGKAVLTVLDFIGQHRREFRFEEPFRALTNLSRSRLLSAVRQDFPRLPSGCEIMLEPKPKQLILENIRTQVEVNVGQLADEVRTYGKRALASFLAESDRDIRDVYRSGRSWTLLLRRAQLLEDFAPKNESDLLKRAPAFLHVDDPDRADVYTRLLSDGAPSYDSLSRPDRSLARMLYFTLWPNGGGFETYRAGLESLRHQVALRSELRQVIALVQENLDHVTAPLDSPSGDSPLRVHASYNREEILAALGVANVGGYMPVNFQSGVRWCPAARTDALFITLEKDEKEFSPQTRYKDYARSETLFHWESQNQTSDTSDVGVRYQEHQTRGTQVLLFVRRFKTVDGRPHPWMLLGPADYVRHEGSKPMAIIWKLHTPLPGDMWVSAKAVS